MGYGFVNPDNLCVVDFSDCENPVNPALQVPSLSELVQQARQTGQMPYGNQRIAVPSYTDDIDSGPLYDAPDRVGMAIAERDFRESIQAKERYLAVIQAKLKAEEEKAKQAPPVPPAPAGE